MFGHKTLKYCKFDDILLMEQLTFEIVIDYRVRHWKGVTNYNVKDVNLLQKIIVFRFKILFLNTAESLKQQEFFKIARFLFFNHCAL
jgi:hypothetical protein